MNTTPQAAELPMPPYIYGRECSPNERVLTVASAQDYARQCVASALAAHAVGVPAGFAVVPDYRGYTNLGTGLYVLNISAKGEAAELIISVATDEERAGREVGESRTNPDGHVINPEDMAVRIRFQNVKGLEVLEGKLQEVRAEHFPAAPAAPAPQVASASDMDGLTFAQAKKCIEALDAEGAKAMAISLWIQLSFHHKYPGGMPEAYERLRAEQRAQAAPQVDAGELLGVLKSSRIALKEAELLLHKVYMDHGIVQIDDGDGSLVSVDKAANRMDAEIDVCTAAIARAEAALKGQAQ